MIDGELTPDQWRLARQAGAAFRDETTQVETSRHGPQTVIPGLAPLEGQMYRNRHTGGICTVLSIVQRRKCWVIFRYQNREYDCDLPAFEKAWEPCRPDGRVR